MIVFYKNKFIILLCCLLAFFLVSSLLITNTSAYAFICNMCAKKQLNYQVELDHKTQQLTHISDAHSQCLIQLQQKLSENQQDIDMLRGHIQDVQHHMSEIILDQKKIYNKLNQILDFSNYNESKSYHDNTQKSSLLNNDNKSEINIDNNVNNLKCTCDDDTDYKTAVSLVLNKKQYIQAIQTFQNFIKNHPKSHYQPNAHYWLGQLYYNQGKKNDAAYYFAWVVKNYPKSLKAADALLKIGIIMQENNQKDKARTIYKQINKLYPNTDSAKQAEKRLMHL